MKDHPGGPAREFLAGRRTGERLPSFAMGHAVVLAARLSCPPPGCLGGHRGFLKNGSGLLRERARSQHGKSPRSPTSVSFRITSCRHRDGPAVGRTRRTGHEAHKPRTPSQALSPSNGELKALRPRSSRGPGRKAVAANGLPFDARGRAVAVYGGSRCWSTPLHAPRPAIGRTLPPVLPYYEGTDEVLN